LNLENRINHELDTAGILNEKARRFFLYVICGTLQGLQIDNQTSGNNIIRRYVGLLPKIGFPYFNSDRNLLILPSEIILDEVLYSDRDLSMFFIIYARFCLFLEILHEIYPSWFEFLSRHPHWVPTSHIKSSDNQVNEIFKEYTANSKLSTRRTENTRADTLEDKRLCDILTQLSGCYYLPFSSDFTPHNRSIFSAIISSSTF
jgi:hypothetical protein